MAVARARFVFAECPLYHHCDFVTGTCTPPKERVVFVHKEWYEFDEHKMEFVNNHILESGQTMHDIQMMYHGTSDVKSQYDTRKGFHLITSAH